MQKLYVQIGSQPAKLVLAPQIGAPPIVGDQVYTLPGAQTLQVTSIEATGITEPLFATLYTGTLVS